MNKQIECVRRREPLSWFGFEALPLLTDSELLQKALVFKQKPLEAHESCPLTGGQNLQAFPGTQENG